MELPSDKATLHSTVCQMNYYRRFVLDFAKIAEPLRTKTLKDTPWEPYTELEITAFETLRHALTTNPILAHPDWDLPFTLHTDACKKA